LTLLSPNTTYYFDIRVGDKKYDNGGVPWTFTTKSTEKSIAPTAEITKASGKPTPTPYQELVIPDGKSPTVIVDCKETDCQKICQKLGKGCATTDLIKNKCLGKVDLTNCSLK